MSEQKSMDTNDSISEAIVSSSQPSPPPLNLSSENIEETPLPKKKKLKEQPKGKKISSPSFTQMTLKKIKETDVKPSVSCIKSSSDIKSEMTFTDRLSSLGQAENIPNDVLEKISDSCKDKLKTILSVANQFRWHCRRRVLTVEDFKGALQVLGVECALEDFDNSDNDDTVSPSISEEENYTCTLRRLK